MMEKKKGGFGSTLLIWLVTGAVAAGIVVGAVSISKKKSVPEEVFQEEITRPVVDTSDLTAYQPDAPRNTFEDRDEEVLDTPVVVEKTPVTLNELLSGSFANKILLKGRGVEEGQRFPLKNTCYRNNISPAISWDGIPSGTKSLALLLVRERDEVHYFFNWGVYNIKPSIFSLSAEQPNDKELANGAIQARNDHRNLGYTGPCEPKGKFPYSFHLFALDTVLDSTADMKLADLVAAMEGHIIDVGSLNAVHYLRF